MITVQDMLDHLQNVFEIKTTSKVRNLFLCRTAVNEAYRELPRMADWRYYVYRAQLQTLASAQLTVSYDHTGGAYERLVTVTTGTLPTSDLHLYQVIIGTNQYEIDRQISSTTFTLSSGLNPGADLTGQSCTLYKSKYHLPVEFRKVIVDPIELARGYRLCWQSPGDLLLGQSGNYQPQEPTCYSVYPSGEYFGASVLEVAPPPNQERTYDFMFERSPRGRVLKADAYMTGTVTTDGTTTIAGTGTAFTSDMVGAVLRLPADGITVAPCGLSYSLDRPTAMPYDVERIILEVNSATSLLVDDVVTTREDVALTISDPVDIDPAVHAELFSRLCEYHYLSLTGRANEAIAKREQVYVSLESSKIANNAQRYPLDNSMGTRPIESLRDLAAARPFDTGGAV